MTAVLAVVKPAAKQGAVGVVAPVVSVEEMLPAPIGCPRATQATLLGTFDRLVAQAIDAWHEHPVQSVAAVSAVLMAVSPPAKPVGQAVEGST